MTQNSVNKDFVKKDDRSRGVHSSKTVKLTAVGQSRLRSGLRVSGYRAVLHSKHFGNDEICEMKFKPLIIPVTKNNHFLSNKYT